MNLHNTYKMNARTRIFADFLQCYSDFNPWSLPPNCRWPSSLSSHSWVKDIKDPILWWNPVKDIPLISAKWFSCGPMDPIGPWHFLEVSSSVPWVTSSATPSAEMSPSWRPPTASSSQLDADVGGFQESSWDLCNPSYKLVYKPT